MKNEEIIKGLKAIYKECGMHFNESSAWMQEFFHEAIKALSQEPPCHCIYYQSDIPTCRHTEMPMDDEEICEDVISREDAIFALYHHLLDKTRKECAEILHEAPSLNTCNIGINRQEAIDAIYSCYIGGKEAVEKSPLNDLYAEGLSEAVKAVEELLPIRVVEKMGRWIDTGSGQECSNCHEIQCGYDNHRLYCANCGSRNEVVKE